MPGRSLPMADILFTLLTLTTIKRGEQKMMKNYCDECGVEITVSIGYGRDSVGNNWSNLQLSRRNGYGNYEFCCNCAKKVMEVLPNLTKTFLQYDMEEKEKCQKQTK